MGQRRLNTNEKWPMNKITGTLKDCFVVPPRNDGDQYQYVISIPNQSDEIKEKNNQ
jgi:hypothetical protein